MKNLLLLISLLFWVVACSNIEPEPHNSSTPQFAQEDSILPVFKDSDTVALVIQVENDSVVKDEISPELWQKYLEVKAKMMSQQPPVRRKDDGFKYELTKEEWAIFTEVHNHMKRESQRIQSKKEGMPN